MPVFEKNPDKSVSRLQKRMHQGMIMKVGQMYEVKEFKTTNEKEMVEEFKTTKKELENSKTELAGAILREKEVTKRYQRLVKRVHAFYVAAFHEEQGVVDPKLLKYVTESAEELNKSISGPPPVAETNKDEKSKDHFQPAPKEDWRLSHEWRELDMETHINESSAEALAILRNRSYDRIGELETRLCLLCLSVFPDNYVLKKRILIYWWIGEGIITAESNRGLTAEEVGEEIFEKLIKNGVIVARKEIGDETVREGVVVASKDYSACPIVNRCSMNPWIRDMLVSVAREARFFDFDKSGKPSVSFEKSLRSCLVSCDPDAIFSRKNDSTILPSSSSGHDSKKDGSSSTRCFAQPRFSWLVSCHPNSAKEDSSITPSDSSAKSCFSRLVSRHPNTPSSGTPSDSSAKSCCSWLLSRGQNIPLASSSSGHALKKEDSSGTPSTKSHDQNIHSASSPSGHALKKEGWFTPLYSFAKSCCPCLVSHNQDSKEDVPADQVKPKEEDLVSVFNVSEDILAFEIDWLSKLKRIEVLQLGRWHYWCEHHIEVENDQVFKSLGSQKFLKYLSLRGISRISFLPASLSGLVNLEILDLKACHNLETLPDISNLKKLTHLDLSECYLLESMPEGIAKLTSLQVLKGFVIGNLARNTSIKKLKTSKLKDLAKLKKLRRLSIVLQTYDKDDDDDDTLNEISSLRDDYATLNEISSLRCLTITWSPKKPVQKRKEKETKEPNQEPLFNCCWYSSSKKKAKEQETEDPPPKQETNEPLSKQETKEPNQEPLFKCSWCSSSKKESKEQETEDPPLKQETKEANQEPLFKCCWYCSSKKEPKKQETEDPLQLSNQEPKKPVEFQLSLPKDLMKLDLRGFPLKMAPEWLNPRNLTTLKKLYLRGGKLVRLTIDDQDGNGSWGVEILRFKFMENFKMDLSGLKETFPSMKYLEKIGCCNDDIIWSKGEKANGRDQDHTVSPKTTANKEKEGSDQDHIVSPETTANKEKEGSDQYHIVLRESAANKEKEGCDQHQNVLPEGRTKFGEIEEIP